ncbi:hypothetical protein JZ751_005456 [Albula glossodonta]|uniref:FAD-binding FR-type domain-containing protein n=1 Tax=Albula glossodonta TaxID=121402 RepID=A0A8T2N5R6_9TELE|nr:hypothetical protein JZ751_005456 [Albula glossodonta]
MALSWKSWIANEGGKHLILVMWLGLNTWLFWRTFILYYSGPQYYYLHKMLGLGLCVSRASASVLNLNCSLVLLPMCRSILTCLRGSHKIVSRKGRRLLDKMVHVLAHLANAVSFSVRYSEEFPSLNVAHHRGEDPRIIILTTVSSYEIFWYTHNLFIVFYIVLLVHVVGGALKYQTNVDTHPPGCFRPNRTDPEPRAGTQPSREPVPPGSEDGDGFNNVCREEAQFQAHFPSTWLWVSGPLCLYCAERLYRYVRGSTPVTIVSVISHPCDVIEVRMLKKQFTARPGQYVVLNCPSISSFEGHPFTLTACPTESKGTFGIHLRVVGDWTERFSELLLPGSGIESEILPIVQQRRYPNSGRRIVRTISTSGCTSAKRKGCSKRVGVFCCGPKGISKTLHKLCNSNHFFGTTFEYNKESFS